MNYAGFFNSLRDLLPFLAVLPSAAYALISLRCALEYFASPVNAEPSAEYPDVTIIKPVKGVDEESYDNFASFCSQDYPGRLQIIFAAASPDDPVVQVVRELMADFSNHDIAMVINPARHGANQKVSNLINAFAGAKYGFIVVSDSDICVEPEYLRSVIAHFADPNVGLVTSLYRTPEVHGIATALEATGFTAEMIPNVLVARRLEGLTFALGASMAVRREALVAIGGFDSLADYLADDYQLGNKIHRAGWRVVLDSCFVESVIKPESLMSVLSRQLRWGRTMRVSRQGGYLASGLTLPFPAILLASLLAPSPAAGLAAIFLLYSIRCTVSTIFSRRLVRDNLFPRWLLLLPLRDMLSFFVWALSFLGKRVEWRGSRFILKPGGKIEEIV
ncbi:MAG: bacteriohopanetetrol glucosamine biosynthesis glycosyltransferase HpnI [Desulfuromonadaceae bacterium]|nr:bacteriohopanetetrol glucosamine biosynthesis glycosyltransferase HpnI [Desulfuromonadaceae bacterium]MDD2855586.1 bacteriohopanetetrol glucosamine biosynthesis glycosyltransferase HpnI [Desulfuromonadaceae bacterium]